MNAALVRRPAISRADEFPRVGKRLVGVASEAVLRRHAATDATVGLATESTGDGFMKFNTFVRRLDGRAAVAACAMTLVACAGVAIGSDDQPLKGPAVKDAGIPGEHRRLTEGQGFDRKDRERPIPQRMFMRAIGELRGESASENLRLTSEQGDKIKSINEGFMAEMEKYRAAHRDEAQALMKDLAPEDRRRAAEMLGVGPRGGEGRDRFKGDAKGKGPKNAGGEHPAKGNDAMEGMEGRGAGKPDPAKAEGARTAMRQLFENAPKPDDTRVQIYAVLRPEQKEFVQKQLEKFRQDGDRMAGERKAGEIKKKLEQGDDKKSLKREEMREKLKDMTPDERRKAMEDYRAKRKGGNAPKSDEDTNKGGG
jgi:hypothetical protein